MTRKVKGTHALDESSLDARKKNIKLQGDVKTKFTLIKEI